MSFRDSHSITSAKQLEPGRHYAILTFGSISIPGDERSRTNPGHGYPAHTETTVHYTKYDTEEAWKQEIARLSNSEFVPMISDLPVVTTKVEVLVRSKGQIQ